LLSSGLLFKEHAYIVLLTVTDDDGATDYRLVTSKYISHHLFLPISTSARWFIFRETGVEERTSPFSFPIFVFDEKR